MHKLRVLLGTFFAAGWLLLYLEAASAQEIVVNDKIREQIERYQMSGQLLVAGEEIAARDFLWQLYENVGYSPL